MSIKVGVLGAGVISDQYLSNLTTFPDLDVVFVADVDPQRARQQAQKYGVAEAGTVDELLAGPAEVVVNLTPPTAHLDTALAAVHAGKHVWLEKPLTTDLAGAQQLLAAADAAGVVVAGAPDSFLGSGIQTALHALASGLVGKLSSALAAFATAGPQKWHPNPEFLFADGGGPLMDVGPYYLTALVQFLGPITAVSALGGRAQQTRTIGAGDRAGTVFPVAVDTTVSALYEFANGTHAAASFSFDSGIRRATLDITGERGTLKVADPNRFAGETTFHPADGTPPQQLPAIGTEITRGIGVVEMARALAAGKRPRAHGQLAAHVLDALVATLESTRTKQPVALKTTVGSIPPLPADWDPLQATLPDDK